MKLQRKEREPDQNEFPVRQGRQPSRDEQPRRKASNSAAPVTKVAKAVRREPEPQPRRKAVAAPAKRTRIESVYRENTNLDCALQLLVRKSGASKDELEAYGRYDSLLYKIRQDYEVAKGGEYGNPVYFVTGRLR